MELYAKWLLARKGLLCQLPSLDGKRLLCHCERSSPFHVDALIATWRSHLLPVSSRVRWMWQVYIDNIDVFEVCDYADLQGLTESGQHEGMVIARERYKRFQVPRSLGKEVMRALQTKALGDQIEGFQGVIGPPAVFVRELIHFTLATIGLDSSRQKVDGRSWQVAGCAFFSSGARE